MVRIHHQGHAAALQRGMDGIHHLDIVLDAEADLHLHKPEAALAVPMRLLDQAPGLALAADPVKSGGIGFDLAAEGTAKKLPDRLAIGLSGDVPQCRVDGADRRHHRTLAPEVT